MITDDQNPLNSSELQNADISFRDQIQGALSTVSMFCNSIRERCPDTNDARIVIGASTDRMPDCSSIFIQSYATLCEMISSLPATRCPEMNDIRTSMDGCSDRVSEGASRVSQSCNSLHESLPSCDQMSDGQKAVIYKAALAAITGTAILLIVLYTGENISECKKVTIKNKSGYPMTFENGDTLYDGYSTRFSTLETATKTEKFDWGIFAPSHCNLELKRNGRNADVTGCAKPNAFYYLGCTYTIEDDYSVSAHGNLRAG